MTRIVARLFFAACLLGNAVGARADDADAPVDARYFGYQPNVVVEQSTALIWLLSLGLIVLGLAVLFLNAKRSHLD